MIGRCPYCATLVSASCAITLTGAKRKVLCENSACGRRYWAWLEGEKRLISTLSQVDEEAEVASALSGVAELPTATTQDNIQAHCVTGYMCTTAWHHHLCGDPSGTNIYPSVQNLKDAHPNCWEECGIVEVEVTITRVILKGAPD